MYSHVQSWWLYYCIIKLNFLSFSRFDIETSKREVLIKDELKNPMGMALDWVHNNLYIVDRDKKIIQVVQIATKYRKTLLHNLTEPISLAADPVNG